MVTAERDGISHGPIGVTAHLSRRRVLLRMFLQPTACAILSDAPPARQRTFTRHVAFFSRDDEHAASVRDTRLDCTKFLPLLCGADLAHPTGGHGCRCRSTRLRSLHILS